MHNGGPRASYFWAYLKLLVKDYTTLLSGGLAVPVAVFSVYYSDTRVNRLLFSLMLVLCTILATFRVWRAERVRVEGAEFPAVKFSPDALIRYDIGNFRYIEVRDFLVTNISAERAVSLLITLRIDAGERLDDTKAQVRGFGFVEFFESAVLPMASGLIDIPGVPKGQVLVSPLNLAPLSSAGGSLLFPFSFTEFGPHFRIGALALEVEHLSQQDKRLYQITNLSNGPIRLFPPPSKT